MTKSFDKWVTKENIEPPALLETIYNLENQLSSVDLGSGLYKVRMARKGQGKSKSFRTLIVHRSGYRTVFVYAFKKSEKVNLSKEELTYWREFANTLLAFDTQQILSALAAGALVEVKDDNP